MISGIPLTLGLKTRMSDRYVYLLLYHILPYHTIIHHVIVRHTIYHIRILMSMWSFGQLMQDSLRYSMIGQACPLGLRSGKRKSYRPLEPRQEEQRQPNKAY